MSERELDPPWFGSVREDLVEAPPLEALFAKREVPAGERVAIG